MTLHIKTNPLGELKAYLSIAIFILPILSCKKFLEIPPPSAAISQNSIFTSDATAIGVLTGMYIDMSKTGLFSGVSSISVYSGLSADEFELYPGIPVNNPLRGYYRNQLSVNIDLASGSECWSPLYNYVFKCNAVIEGLNSASGLTPQVKQQLLGEAKFLRGLFYFYLVNLFGNVPLALSTDPKINTLLPRIAQEKIYLQIISDLKEAGELLSADYLNETLLHITSERVRLTRWAAMALLARVYLYSADYKNTEIQATNVITHNLFRLTSLNDAFLKNSTEAIWQLQPVNLNFNTQDAPLFVIPSTGPNVNNNFVYLSKFLLNSFEPGDQRGLCGNWIDSTIYPIDLHTYDTVYYAYKYKVNSSPGVASPNDMSEYLTILRMGEQYLIRAEARAKQGDINGAQADLNAIRSRAGLGPITANDQTSLLAAILHERQVELFTEFGHRWLDLKRTGNIHEVMNIITPLKANGIPWQAYQQWYPLPQFDLNKAPNLIQNDGY